MISLPVDISLEFDRPACVSCPAYVSCIAGTFSNKCLAGQEIPEYCVVLSIYSLRLVSSSSFSGLPSDNTAGVKTLLIIDISHSDLSDIIKPLTLISLLHL